MSKLEKNLSTQIKNLLDDARNTIVQAVNTTMVYTYYEIGRLIVENEQQGKTRAEYGKNVLQQVSRELTREFGKGFSVQNLENMRCFYLIYSKSSTLSRISEKNQKLSAIPAKTNLLSQSKKSQTVSGIFTLSWSHYVFLMRLDENERNFYEQEAHINNWSLRELKRQFDSALFERLLLSKDKTGVLADNLKKYHSPQRPEDIIKDPYILEFLGLEESSKYSETELETRIIDKLQQGATLT